METLLTVVAAVGGVTIMVAVGIFGADWSELLTRGEQFIVGQPVGDVRTACASRAIAMSGFELDAGELRSEIARTFGEDGFDL